MTIALGTGLLILLMLLGVPIGFALGLAAIGGLAMVVPTVVIWGQMSQVVHEVTANFVILTIPMFVLMAEFLSAGNIAEDMMIACNRLMRRIRGGLAMATVFAGTVLAAASGSSTASVASITRASFPTMERLGYAPSFALGSIAISGTLAIMIPPSVAFIVYGLMTEVSIGKLFMAGLVPGLLTATGYILTIWLKVRLNPDLAPAGDGPVKGEPEQKGQVWPMVMLVLVVLVCLYTGIATPTEVGAIGALGALVLSVGMRRMTGPRFVTAVGNALRTSALIVTIIFGATLFGFFVSYTQVTPKLLAWIAEAGLAPFTVLMMVVAIYLVLGMIMDQFAIIVLTAPVAYQLLTGLGYDGVWFGVIVVKAAEIGLVSPPMGLNVFIASSAAGVETRTAFRGVMPFVACELAILALLIAFPGLSLWLPGMM
ncbi:MAG: TRAP transporter large permease [Sagittula sp.]|uniref:TRAP transporter large permease n=1 Tax=Sagittula sp. TaxID=2038081 RepID=UPI0040584C96